ncbi:MAG: phosphate acyltransferase PlsX [bacterium]
MITIAVDAMGGDFAPKNNIEGAIHAVNTFDIKIILVGQENKIKAELKKYPNYPKEKIDIEHANDVINMTDSPTKAFRQKKNSSIHIGLNLVKKNIAQGFVSPGNTGAILTTSTLILGRSNGVERPALASAIPSSKGPFVLLDLGSTVDCKSSHLQQFAIMGHYFAKLILHINKPRIALLNIGEEEEKGNILTQESHSLLKELPYNFIGNIEANELLFGHSDVVVCDGFVGNNILKFGESISKLISNFIKDAAKKSFIAVIGILFLKKNLKEFKKKFSYETYGGAQLLGINGISIIAHGNAKPEAIKNAIRIAKESIECNMTEKISSSIKKYHNQTSLKK